MPPAEDHDFETAADNTSLVHMNEDSILENLERRHKQDLIYTYTASVLLAVNPYKTIAGLYGDDQCNLYRGKHIGALPPHPYAIADTAYRMLNREKADQALLISGESGAGKTETAKIVMKYLAFASGSVTELTSRIQQRVLQAQPILESLGNASTLRNSNSSRFGKYNQVHFDGEGALVDAGIDTYLLESSRVVVHGEGERTYHIFYEMLQGLSDQDMKAYHLDKSQHYHLMHQNPDALVDGMDEHDKKNFDRFKSALQTIGQESSIAGILRILAGLLHLSDIPCHDAETEMAAWSLQDDEDQPADGRTVEVKEDSVQFAAELLGMDPDDLCGVLKRKCITIPGRESIHEVARNPVQFRQTLHSFIKAIYKRLFEQTVCRINESFRELRAASANVDEVYKSIGILDIYGFERLKQNSLEQLCINLANERLQQCFVENFLVAEQDLYKREALEWTNVSLPNSGPVVNCIGQVFKTLDDFSSRLAKGFGAKQQVSDDHFCEKVLRESSADAARKDVLKPFKVSAKNRNSTTGPRVNEVFIVVHYAGTVDYTTKGWLDKNNDRLLRECEDLISGSSYDPLKALAEEDTKQPFRSISSKYCKDLEALLGTLSESNLHYIRCFKPNAVQKPAQFDHPLVCEQIVQCGTVELVKIMHDGFPNRCTFDELFRRFKSLLPEQFQRYGNRTFIEALMLAYEVPRTEWALGMTRLFLKAGQLKALEDMRSGGASAPKPEVLEKIVKQIVRKRWVRACSAIRLCLWLPKLLRQINLQRAQRSLAAITLVASRLAPKLMAAKRRVAERRQKARRRLAGTFRIVACLRRHWREIRDKRRERAGGALYLASRIVARMKPRIASARGYIREAEVRRKREEERLRREMEERLRREEEERLQRVREEEERLRLEAEQRRQEEEAEAERRRLREEEERRIKKQQEEEAAERLRLEQEAERVRLENERVAEEEQRRLEQEQQAEAERLQREEERLKLEADREHQMAEMEAARLKQKEELEEEKRLTREKVREEMEAELKADKQRILEQQEADRQLAAEKLDRERMENEKAMQEQKRIADEEARRQKEELVAAVKAETQRLMEESAREREELQARMEEKVAKLKAQNEELECRAVENEKRQASSQKIKELEAPSPLDITPLPNGTPTKEQRCVPSPLALEERLSASPETSGTGAPRSSRPSTMNPGRRFSISGSPMDSESRGKRRSASSRSSDDSDDQSQVSDDSDDSKASSSSSGSLLSAVSMEDLLSQVSEALRRGNEACLKSDEFLKRARELETNDGSMAAEEASSCTLH